MVHLLLVLMSVLGCYSVQASISSTAWASSNTVARTTNTQTASTSAFTTPSQTALGTASTQQPFHSSPTTDSLTMFTSLVVSTTKSKFDEGTTSTATSAEFSADSTVIMAKGSVNSFFETSPSIWVSTSGRNTSSFVAETTTPTVSSSPSWFLFLVVGIAGMLLVALLIAIAIIILLVAKKRSNSGKLVLQHTCSSQNLRPPGTISRGGDSNKIFDQSNTSALCKTVLSPKTSYFIETSQNDVNMSNDASYQSKSVSMESLGCICDEDEVSTMQNIAVPTQGQRRCIAENIIKGSSRHLYTILRNQQKSLHNVVANGKDESGNYWRPSHDHDSLYQQLFENKYVEIPRNKIKILSYLRSETLGIVHKGLWHSSTGLKEVAVRLLHEDASCEEKVLFLQEAAINGQFSKHPNLVQLYGLATLKNPILIVMEFLDKDLKSFLTAQRTIPDARDLISFCQQVASGMKFLSDRRFVHRNLMAQNIFLTEHGICKIGGFGTSLLIENEQIRISHGISVETRWAAPEVIQSRMYSSFSDVWSYGVLMYEIWSKGTHTPYEQLTDQQVAKEVNGGTRLEQPSGCPKAVYKIMTECWHLNPESRPPFSMICTRLSDNLLLGNDDCTPVSRL